MKRFADPIVAVLREPQQVGRFSPADWDLLIRQARATHLLTTLAYALQGQGLEPFIPDYVQLHLQSSLVRSQRQERALGWEIACLQDELSLSGVPLVLLKGAAYAVAKLPFSAGRMFSDIDILVPKAQIGRVEDALKISGWQGSHHEAYDQRYYREWMHEIPPMRHISRGTTLDVHHTILPETARIKVQTQALWSGVRLLPEPGLGMLQPTDMLLHSATHLFHEGDFEKGLRDLFDLDGMFRHFGPTPGFWDDLVPRAQALGLTRPLYYALRYATGLLGTEVPAEVLAAADAGRPGALALCAMDACYARALRPDHASTNTFGTWLARFALYLRSHWIRMPLRLLAYHLGRKTVLRFKPREQDEKSIADADRQKA